MTVSASFALHVFFCGIIGAFVAFFPKIASCFGLLAAFQILLASFSKMQTKCIDFYTLLLNISLK